jgi:Zn ribbon nucleic-acid-binding protein
VTATELIDAIKMAGGVLTLQGDDLKCLLPKSVAHLGAALRERKPELRALIRARGGRVAVFPHCPQCGSFALYRENNQGSYECLTCGLRKIEECRARRIKPGPLNYPSPQVVFSA